MNVSDTAAHGARLTHSKGLLPQHFCRERTRRVGLFEAREASLSLPMPGAARPATVGAYFKHESSDEASRALVEYGFATQSIESPHRQRRVTRRPEPQLFHTVQRKTPTKPKRPKEVTQEDEPVEVLPRGPSEHEIIMGRIGELIGPYDGAEDDGQPHDVNRLKVKIRGILNTQGEHAQEINIALKTANVAVDADGAIAEPSVGRELVTELSADAQATSVELISQAVEEKQRNSDQLIAVRRKERELYGTLHKTVAHLGRDAEEKESALKSAQAASLQKDMILADAQAELRKLQEAHDKLKGEHKKLREEALEMKRELDKPIPPPPISREEADQLREDVANARRDRSRAKEDLLLRNEELKALERELKTMKDRLHEQQQLSQVGDDAVSEMRAAHEAELRRLVQGKEDLEAQLRDLTQKYLESNCALEELQTESDRFRAQLLLELAEANERYERTHEAFQNALGDSESGETQLASERATFQARLEQMQRDCDAALAAAALAAEAAATAAEAAATAAAQQAAAAAEKVAAELASSAAQQLAKVQQEASNDIESLRQQLYAAQKEAAEAAGKAAPPPPPPPPPPPTPPPMPSAPEPPPSNLIDPAILEEMRTKFEKEVDELKSQIRRLSQPCAECAARPKGPDKLLEAGAARPKEDQAKQAFLQREEEARVEYEKLQHRYDEAARDLQAARQDNMDLKAELKAARAEIDVLNARLIEQRAIAAGFVKDEQAQQAPPTLLQAGVRDTNNKDKEKKAQEPDPLVGFGVETITTKVRSTRPRE